LNDCQLGPKAVTCPMYAVTHPINKDAAEEGPHSVAYSKIEGPEGMR
jgi:hypothetical protein